MLIAELSLEAHVDKVGRGTPDRGNCVCKVKDVRRKMESVGHYSEFRVQQRKRLGSGEGLAINNL